MDLPIQTLRAPNPGPFTGTGTNTYLIGTRRLLVVDPGPDLAAHREAILAAIAGRSVEAVVVTHAHLDHSALAPDLAHRTGASVLAFGDATFGMSAQMQRLAAQGLQGGEGSDASFQPDRRLSDGDILTTYGLSVEVIHTPGHMSGHIALALGDTLLSGDHVMGWSTSIVSPPEGDMADYMASLRKLADRRWQRFLPGHGGVIDAPDARLAELIAHRLGREAAVLESLRSGPATPAELAARIYAGLDPALLPAAARNVLAHLIDLAGRGLACQAAVDAGLPLAESRFARL